MLPWQPRASPNPNGDYMLTHRVRALAASLPIVVLSAVLVASPGFAAESLGISTPLAGETVSGELLITGSIVGSVAAGEAGEVTVSLAPQTLGDCGSAVIESPVVPLGQEFTTRLATITVPDGTYCLVAVADAGRLSTVVGDITVDNSVMEGESLDGFQLPTESLGGEAGTVVTRTPNAVPFADFALLGPIVLGATATLAALVLGFALWARQRSTL